ncbi:MAG: DNA polymerase III subunit delta [Bacteroidales bacterium]|nr:DNA polymerase III subunit delta [Bacteroidales bacterium]MDD6746477.1 DNA polymerase III subunit delta [Bacteroidales bacterium]
MAEKTTGTTYDSIMRALKAGNFSPIYILMGDEPYFLDKITDYIADNVLQPEERDFNQSVVFGSDVTAAQVVDLAREFPMMATHRVVIVKEAQSLKNADLLVKYLATPVPSTILVLCYKGGKVDRSVLVKAKTSGIVFESKKKRDYELPDFIMGYLKLRGVTIDNKSASMIAEHIGADLSRLTSELEKVMISLPANDRRITPDVVEQQIGVSKDFNVFELKNAIVTKNIFKANQIIKYFDNNPKAGSLYSFVPLLFNYFQNLMIAHYAPEKNNENALANYLELKSSWAAKEYITGMRNYSATKVLNIIHMIKVTDAKSKGIGNVSTSTGDLAKELLFFILH